MAGRRLIAHYHAWRRRAGAAPPSGSMAAAIAGSATLVATLTGLAAMSAALGGAGALTGTLEAVAAGAATIAGVATLTATISAIGSMESAITGSSSLTATLAGVWSISYGSMTFSRASQGSYYTSAPTDGSSSFISVASNNVLRTDNRGDGAGSLTLLEGQRTNSVVNGRGVSDTNYWTHGAGTFTADAGNGPDGSASADRSNVASNSNVQKSGFGSGYMSAYARAYSGTTSWNIGDGAVFSGTSSLSTTYQRRGVYGGTTLLPIDSYNRSGSGGVAAAASDVLIDFVQYESGARFPSTPIGTNGSTITRSADTLTLAQASVPALLFTGRGRFTQVSPLWAAADLVSGDAFWLLSIGGSSNGIRVRHDGFNVLVEAVAGGVVKAYSYALSNGRDGLLGAIAWDPAGGVISVGGVNGPAGTAWSWSAADIRVGGIYGGAGEAFARFGTLESW